MDRLTGFRSIYSPWQYMGVSKNNGFPKSSSKSSIFHRVFHYKPSILGYHHFKKHSYIHPGNVCNMMVNACTMNNESSHGVVLHCQHLRCCSRVFFFGITYKGLPGETVSATKSTWKPLGVLVGSDEFPFVLFFGLLLLGGNCSGS